jgi:hypothetical protein
VKSEPFPILLAYQDDCKFPPGQVLLVGHIPVIDDKQVQIAILGRSEKVSIA